MTIAFAAALAILSTSLSPELPASYRMEVSLDTSKHILQGTEQVVFLNPTNDTLDQVCFHLYPNAFRDTSSVFAREADETRRIIASDDTSSLVVSNIEINGSGIAATAIKETGTLLYVTLPSPLPPGDSVQISLDFKLVVPRHHLRFGYNDAGNYMLSHWHPILCGYQNGRLIDNEYYFSSEFFSNFSNYDVRIEVPSEFEIGSTGELSLIGQDSTSAFWQATADTVIDFAFACGPAYKVHEFDSQGIKVRYLIEHENEKILAISDSAVQYSLKYCSEKLFPYPYKTFTIVDHDIGAQGMELPGMNAIPFPEKIRTATRESQWFVIAHEIAHEWFYATIATNEAEEPWLDEGISTYFTTRIIEDAPGNVDEISVFGYKVPMNTLDRLIAHVSKAEWPVNLRSWDYPDDFSYSAAVYFRASTALKTLEQMVGKEAFDNALKEYAQKYRFRHPTTAEFGATLDSTLDVDIESFFRQFISGTARIDYSVSGLNYKSISKNTESPRYEIKVTAGREFDGILPHRIKIGLRDGTVIDTLWNGAARTQIFRLEASSRPEYAIIGYDSAPYALDQNTANNSIYKISFSSRLLTFEWDIVFALELFLSLFL